MSKTSQLKFFKGPGPKIGPKFRGDLAARFPDLADGLEAIIDRLVDPLPIAIARYYHPSQHGSWSLKAVLPAAVPDLSYDNLDGVANGGMAVAAYQEAIHPATLPERKRELEAQRVGAHAPDPGGRDRGCEAARRIRVDADVAR